MRPTLEVQTYLVDKLGIITGIQSFWGPPNLNAQVGDVVLGYLDRNLSSQNIMSPGGSTDVKGFTFGYIDFIARKGAKTRICLSTYNELCTSLTQELLVKTVLFLQEGTQSKQYYG